jgi:hypothetical protein
LFTYRFAHGAAARAPKAADRLGIRSVAFRPWGADGMIPFPPGPAAIAGSLVLELEICCQ